VTEDLAAMTDRDGTAWLVGAHGTVVIADTRPRADRRPKRKRAGGQAGSVPLS
jgi:hypothetical protein